MKKYFQVLLTAPKTSCGYQLVALIEAEDVDDAIVKAEAKYPKLSVVNAKFLCEV